MTVRVGESDLGNGSDEKQREAERGREKEGEGERDRERKERKKKCHLLPGQRCGLRVGHLPAAAHARQRRERIL